MNRRFADLPNGPRPGRRPSDITVLAILIVLAVATSSLTRQQTVQIEAAVRGTLLWPALELHRAATDYVGLRGKNEELQVGLDSLARQLTWYRSRAAEADGLRQALSLRVAGTDSLVAVAVYPGRPQRGNPSVFLLDGPELDEIQYPTGVFTWGGLVGVARSRHGDGARGTFWSHSEFRVSVRTEDGSISGIARAYTEAGQEPRLVVDYVLSQGDLEQGTLLVTTGLADIYPPGVPVGYVRELLDSGDPWTKRFLVDPVVRLETVRVAHIRIMTVGDGGIPQEIDESG